MLKENSGNIDQGRNYDDFLTFWTTTSVLPCLSSHNSRTQSHKDKPASFQHTKKKKRTWKYWSLCQKKIWEFDKPNRDTWEHRLSAQGPEREIKYSWEAHLELNQDDQNFQMWVLETSMSTRSFHKFRTQSKKFPKFIQLFSGRTRTRLYKKQ